MSTFKQTQKIGLAGSFINQMMANNSTLPEVGKGATIMHYTDRNCYEVVEVSEDKKTVKLQYLEAKADISKAGGHGHQDWLLLPTENYMTVTWRNGAWRKVCKEIIFTDEFVKDCESKGINFIGQWVQKNNPELANKIWGDHIVPINVVEGYTKEKKSFIKINILFGVKDYYYDWSL